MGTTLRVARHQACTHQLKPMSRTALIKTSMAVCVAACTAVMPPPVLAQTIFGTPDCGQWVNDRPVAREQNKSWLLGYLSGLNVRHQLAGLKPADPLDKLNSADQAFLWVDNYCKANPLRKVSTAGFELFLELAK